MWSFQIRKNGAKKRSKTILSRKLALPSEVAALFTVGGWLLEKVVGSVTVPWRGLRRRPRIDNLWFSLAENTTLQPSSCSSPLLRSSPPSAAQSPLANWLAKQANFLLQYTP
ncbi:hypothetical protein VNO80_06891 [Phaseolus coccineus]|uniref:Uncharacterized protein n=1 Tax=Phaseolus coccineus TaxID=3886 RepID=A0AAN9NIS3_PHACN